MKKRKHSGLNFEIDKLTNSIENESHNPTGYEVPVGIPTTSKMKHYIHLSITFLIFSITTTSFAQTGEIKGRVVDKKAKSAVPFATVTVQLNGVVVGGNEADKDGKYFIKPLALGRYDVKAGSNGYQPVVVKGVLVEAEKSTDVTLQMQPDSIGRKPIIRQHP